MRIGFRDVFFQSALNDPAKGPCSPGGLRRSPRRVCKELPSKSLSRASLTAVVPTEKIRPGTFPAKNRPHGYETRFYHSSPAGTEGIHKWSVSILREEKIFGLLAP